MNAALSFDRSCASGKRLDIPAGPLSHASRDVILEMLLQRGFLFVPEQGH